MFGAGDCRESNYCSGRGSCVDGKCECPPQYLDANCSVKLTCRYWDAAEGEWSTAGVTTSVAADGKGAACATTHLTTFGGIVSIPTSTEELLAELTAAFKFNTFTLEEMFTLLSEFRRARTHAGAMRYSTSCAVLRLTCRLSCL